MVSEKDGGSVLAFENLCSAILLIGAQCLFVILHELLICQTGNKLKPLAPYSQTSCPGLYGFSTGNKVWQGINMLPTCVCTLLFYSHATPAWSLSQTVLFSLVSSKKLLTRVIRFKPLGIYTQSGPIIITMS